MWGEPPALATAPSAQAGCCQQIPRPTAKPLPSSGCISKGSQGVMTAQGGRQAPLLMWHKAPLRGGRRGASSRTSSPPHAYRQPAKSCPPRGPEFSPGTHPVSPEGKAPKRMARHSPRGLPDADKAVCLRRCCWLQLPAWQGSERPARCGVAMGWMQGCPRLWHPLGEPGRDRDAMHWCYRAALPELRDAMTARWAGQLVPRDRTGRTMEVGTPGHPRRLPAGVSYLGG